MTDEVPTATPGAPIDEDLSPLQFDLDVRCDPARAFAMWTDEISRWWPIADHTTSGDAEALVIEPRAGGRIFERTHAGAEVEWGQVRVYEPPVRLVFKWHIGADASDATEVELTFRPGTGGGTAVRLVHRGWDALAADAAERREGNLGGWSGVLESFEAAANA